MILVLCFSLLSFSLEKQQNIKGTELLLAIVLGDFIRGNIVRCVCVCVCVCVYTYIHTYLHAYTHTCVRMCDVCVYVILVVPLVKGRPLEALPVSTLRVHFTHRI